MSVKARWTEAVVDVDDSDPFAEALTPVRVKEVGVPIKLDGEVASLDRRLVENVQSQNTLYNQGIDCALRWQADVTCSACPVYHGDEKDSSALLCRLAREQETILTTLAVQRHRGG